MDIDIENYCVCKQKHMNEGTLEAVEEAKREADKLMLNKIAKYERRIRRLKSRIHELE